MTDTLDKILKMLPARITHQQHYNYLQMDKFPDKVYIFSYSLKPFYDGIAKECRSKNPAEAAGELLAWCIENGHVKEEK